MDFKTECNGTKLTAMGFINDGEGIEVQMFEEGNIPKLSIMMTYGEAFRLMEYLCFAIKDADDFSKHHSSPFCFKQTFWRHEYCGAQCEECRYIEANKK